MRKIPKKKGASGESRWIYGARVIQEYLIAKPQAVHTLHILSSLTNIEIKRLAEQAQVPVHYETLAFFSAFGQDGVHQGVAANLSAFPYVSLQAILKKKADFLLMLDGIVDPRNLGALLRTADAAGVGGVILTKDRSAPLSAVVEKAAVGATVHLSLCRVENLARALSVIKNAGYWIVGLTPDASTSLYEVDFPEKIAVLLGGEEKGLRSLTRSYSVLLSASHCRRNIREKGRTPSSFRFMDAEYNIRQCRTFSLSSDGEGKAIFSLIH